ncbi:hypothetical protein ED208_04565 [Stagnimonas aquatica]|uniref:Uncharacterized protein n=2 Tax=Stagnimonas aquatica TaxID=2689987 RepID=A0A3N0VFZ4_9GAMM|nr:hypothetical protein ED208_04565 [Stagnimonas aquatica]
MHGKFDDQAKPLRLPVAATASAPSPVNGRDLSQLIRLGREARLDAGRVLLSDLGVKSNQYIRVFFWAMVDGADDHQPQWRGTNSYGAPPQLLISLLDGSGRKIAQGPERIIAAFGPFPWHCYYQDLWLPQNAAALNFTFKNAWNKKAQFSGFSWQSISEAEASEGTDALQDPVSGSLATNIAYDSWSGHLRKLGNRYPWKFLQGPTIGLKGVHHDLTTARGLGDFFEQEALSDEDQLNHGVLYLARTFYKGKELGLLPEHMPADWDQQLLKLVLSAQDSKTGYWGTRKRPRSMGITFHLVNGLFSFGISREGEPAVPDRDRLLPAARLPGADRIVETTLKMQSRSNDGERKMAGWARSAYNYTGSPDRSESKASLVVTGNAIELLRRSELFVEPAARVQIYSAIKSAVRYVLDCCLEDDGAWRQSDVDESASSDSYMFRILDKSHYLERKLGRNRPPPAVRLVGQNEGAPQFAWHPSPGVPQSLRVYASGSNGHETLVAIVETNDAPALGSDPYTVVGNIRMAAERRWRSVWNPQSFLMKRLSEVADAERILLAPGQTRFSLRLPVPSQPLSFVSADWYGEESAPAELPMNAH